MSPPLRRPWQVACLGLWNNGMGAGTALSARDRRKGPSTITVAYLNAVLKPILKVSRWPRMRTGMWEEKVLAPIRSPITVAYFKISAVLLKYLLKFILKSSRWPRLRTGVWAVHCKKRAPCRPPYHGWLF